MSRDKMPFEVGGCVGICSRCLGFMADAGDESHRGVCPHCMAEVVMTPRIKIESGLKEVAELLEKMQPCSIFHGKSIQPWPVLVGGLWHVDLRPGDLGPYARLAEQWFPHDYDEKMERVFDAVIPDVGYMGDLCEESLVIPQDEMASEELTALAQSLQACRKDAGELSPAEWMRTMEEWLDVWDLEDLEDRRGLLMSMGNRRSAPEQELLQCIRRLIREKRKQMRSGIFGH